MTLSRKYSKYNVPQPVALPGEVQGRAIAPPSQYWPDNQNTEQEKYHVFSSSETVFLAVERTKK